MMKTTIGNLKRESRRSGIYIGRGSPYGNPFKIGEHGNRDEVIKRFEKYFYERLKKEKKFRTAVNCLRGKHLLCYCSPLTCHGNVIADYLNAKEEGR